MTLAATTLVGIQAHIGVVRSGDSVTSYHAHIGGDTATWLADLFEHCRHHWGNRVPTAEAERRKLRDLCQAALSFENDYLQACRDYLLSELHQQDPARQRTATTPLFKVNFTGCAPVKPDG